MRPFLMHFLAEVLDGNNVESVLHKNSVITVVVEDVHLCCTANPGRRWFPSACLCGWKSRNCTTMGNNIWKESRFVVVPVSLCYEWINDTCFLCFLLLALLAILPQLLLVMFYHQSIIWNICIPHQLVPPTASSHHTRQRWYHHTRIGWKRR